MTTLLVSQTNGEKHVTPKGHAERFARLEAIEKALAQPQFAALKREDAQPGDLSLAELVHSKSVMDTIRDTRPAEGIGQIDSDTFVSSTSLEASATALGGG